MCMSLGAARLARPSRHVHDTLTTRPGHVHRRSSWTLRASRSTEETPEEQHYRLAESAFCRGGGVAAQIASIDYHFHPALEAALAEHKPHSRAEDAAQDGAHAPVRRHGEER